MLPLLSDSPRVTKWIVCRKSSARAVDVHARKGDPELIVTREVDSEARQPLRRGPLLLIKSVELSRKRQPDGGLVLNGRSVSARWRRLFDYQLQNRGNSPSIANIGDKVGAISTKAGLCNVRVADNPSRALLRPEAL
jgi:hypothetical protein